MPLVLEYRLRAYAYSRVKRIVETPTRKAYMEIFVKTLDCYFGSYTHNHVKLLVNREVLFSLA